MAVQVDYGSIIRRSIEITKKNKWLWVYGLLVAAGSANFNSSGGGDSSDTFKEFFKESEDLPEKTSYVLGQATTLLGQWFSSVPITTWLLLGLAFLFIMLVFTVVMMIFRTWARASLISGLEMAEKDETVTLVNTAPKGWPYVKHLILLSLITFGITFGVALIGLIPLILGLVLLGGTDSGGTLWIIVWLFLFGITFLIFLVLLTMLSIYAERLIVLNNYTPWNAWKKGLSLSKHHFLPTSIMGIINVSLGCVTGCVTAIVLLIVLGIPGFLLAIPLFSGGFNIISAVGLAFLLFMFLYGNMAVNAVFAVFKFSNWQLFFTEVIKYEGENIK